MTIDIKGLDKAELLAALVNGGRPLGLGFLHAGTGPMTHGEAREWIDKVRGHDDPNMPSKPLRFDYVRGRPIKSDLSGDTLNPFLYDRDQGDGAAARVVAELRAKGVSR